MNIKQFIIALLWIIALTGAYLDLRGPVMEFFNCEIEVKGVMEK